MTPFLYPCPTRTGALPEANNGARTVSYTHLSIVDVLRDAAPYINDERGRRLTLVEQCRKRWLHGAAENLHSVDYNGKYEDEERGNGNE